MNVCVKGAMGVLVTMLSASQAANAALISRLGGLAVYDDDLNATWLANANLARSNTFGVSGINSDGTMNWSTANDWINAMNAENATGYMGFNDWRLPITTQPDATCSGQYDPGGSFSVQGFGQDCTASEMGHLKNVEDIYWDDPAPPSLFSNIEFIEYWSGTEYEPDTSRAWTHGFDLSGQDALNKSTELVVWAVRTGDVSAVPVPAAAWLFGSGVVGLIGMARRKKTA